MQTLYRSTRDPKGQTITASQAVLQGLSPDGGLYVPTSIPEIDLDLNELKDLSYQDLAYKILRPLFSDYTDEELHLCIDKAYGDQWDTQEIAPVDYHADNAYLELFHGPTIAFKDVALQLLPHLMTVAAKKNGSDKDIVILTATSGDTGKAAMAGFADVPHTQIIVFYPKDGVSAIQEKQMLTQTGKIRTSSELPAILTLLKQTSKNFSMTKNSLKRLPRQVINSLLPTQSTSDDSSRRSCTISMLTENSSKMAGSQSGTRSISAFRRATSATSSQDGSQRSSVFPSTSSSVLQTRTTS